MDVVLVVCFDDSDVVFVGDFVVVVFDFFDFLFFGDDY
jgi:hypothetical protein